MNNTIKPFIKWVGGKTQLLDILNKNLPNDLNNIDTYIEPFIGGGAMLFNVVPQLPNIKKIIISDLNYKLINVYNVIKDNKLFDKFKNILLQYQYTYDNLLISDERKNLFYTIRKNFNLYDKDIEERKSEHAAEFIFLNKTCFNGLYRENLKGEFNAPWNKSKKACIYDEENLNNVHDFLNKYNVQIYSESFQDAVKRISYKDKALVYFDPPYRPLTKTSAFTSYTKSSFNDIDQKNVKKCGDLINLYNSYFMISNSDPKNVDVNDDFFDELYKDYNIIRIPARRCINSKGDKRGVINELLIKNF